MKVTELTKNTERELLNAIKLLGAGAGAGTETRAMRVRARIGVEVQSAANKIAYKMKGIDASIERYIFDYYIFLQDPVSGKTVQESLAVAVVVAC